MIRNVAEVTEGARRRAAASGRPVIDLGQGTPSDPTPVVVQEALAAAADAPGYPPAHGTPALRRAYHDWAERAFGFAPPPDDVIATVGSKELIATLPWMLGLTASDTVVIPRLAYPTYRTGAELAGCRVVAADSLTAVGPAPVSIVWVNSPGNPTGRVLPADHLAKMVTWARERDCLLVSDECYIELTPPGVAAPSVLSREVNGGSFANVLAVHSLSKRSSMAGYRCGFVSGDPDRVSQLLRRRRDAGLIVPAPVQSAAVAALSDGAHVAELRLRYAARRQVLGAALREAGFVIDDSEAGLFLWVRREGASGAEVVEWLADRGIVAAPGAFYGAAGQDHVRLSLTAPDDLVAEAAGRVLEG